MVPDRAIHRRRPDGRKAITIASVASAATNPPRVCEPTASRATNPRIDTRASRLWRGRAPTIRSTPSHRKPRPSPTCTATSV